MEKDKHTTDIIFRVITAKDFKGTVLALFPHEVSNFDGSVTSYEHNGQHGSADYDHCVGMSRLATEDEAKSLKTEMEGLGYNIRVLKKRHYNKYLADLKRVRGMK